MTANSHTQSTRPRLTASASTSLLNTTLTTTAHHRHSGHQHVRQHGSHAQHPTKPHHPAHHKEKLPPGIQFQPF